MQTMFIAIKDFEVGDAIIFKDTTLTAKRKATNGVYFWNSRTQKEEFKNFKFREFPSNQLIDNGWTFDKGAAIFVKDFNRELESL